MHIGTTLPSTALKLASILLTLTGLGPLPASAAVAVAGACTRGSPERLLVRTLAAVEDPALAPLAAEVRAAVAVWQPKQKRLQQPASNSRSERARAAARARWSRQAAGILPGVPAVSFDDPQIAALMPRPKLSRSEAARKAAQARWARFQARACGTLPHVAVPVPAELRAPTHDALAQRTHTDASAHARTPMLSGGYASSDANGSHAPDASRPHASDASAHARSCETAAISRVHASSDASPHAQCVALHAGTLLALGSEDQIKKISLSDPSDPRLTGTPRGSEDGALADAGETIPESGTRPKTEPRVSKLPPTSPQGLMECPQDLRLSLDQRGNLQMAGFTSGRILELETRFVVQYGMCGERRQPARWRERLYGFALAAGPKDKFRPEAPRTAVVSGDPIPCPAGLRLTDQQREAFISKAGYTFDRIVHLEQSFVVRYGSEGATDSPEGWRRRLTGYVTACGRAQSVMTSHGPKPCGPAIFPVTEPRPLAKAPPEPPELRLTDEERARLEALFKPGAAPAPLPAGAPRPRVAIDPEELKRRLEAARSCLKTG